jgi:dipeptidase E
LCGRATVGGEGITFVREKKTAKCGKQNCHYYVENYLNYSIFSLNMARNLLLISNSKVAGGKSLAHASEEIKDILGDREVVRFVPYANPSGMGHKAYVAALQPIFQEMGYDLQLLDGNDPTQSVKDAEAIFIGGGNTWQLLKDLKDKRLAFAIRDAVNNGTIYMGSSAGSNVAGLTIGNTNDMPAAECYGRDALGLVPFNVNPHYQDTVKLSAEEREAVLKVAPQLKILIDHQGETRDVRLTEYHALGNIETVVALREGAMLRVTDDHVHLKGTTGAKVFKPGEEPVEHQAGATLDFLL